MADRHIVIVGGGFSGTALAIHLARRGKTGLKVTVIEPREQLGRGVAYDSRDPAHRVNVSAERMHLSAAEEGDFDRWFRASAVFDTDIAARWQDGKVYPQRQAFGAYINQQYHHAAESSAVALRHVRDRAVAFENGAVITASGEGYQADEVVLAISHPPPALPGILKPLKDHPGVISNPWQAEVLASVAPDDRVAIIGTGLTMSDVVASLHRQGHQGAIVAFSRRGQLPRDNLSGPFNPRALDYSQPQAVSVRGWLRRIRQEVALAAEQGLPWQLVLDDIRANGQRLWQQLSLPEQQRFLRHLRPWWDVHRYRIAPQISALLQQLQTAGQLRVEAARLTAVRAQDNTLQLTLQPRGNKAAELLTVDKIIVTTGPAHAGLLNDGGLLSQLAAQGVIQADPLALGIWVNAESQTLNTQGTANPHLWVSGPAARGRFGELMGLPQVAEHAERVAELLLS